MVENGCIVLKIVEILRLDCSWQWLSVAKEDLGRSGGIKRMGGMNREKRSIFLKIITPPQAIVENPLIFLSLFY